MRRLLLLLFCLHLSIALSSAARAQQPDFGPLQSYLRSGATLTPAQLRELYALKLTITGSGDSLRIGINDRELGGEMVRTARQQIELHQRALTGLRQRLHPDYTDARGFQTNRKRGEEEIQYREGIIELNRGIVQKNAAWQANVAAFVAQFKPVAPIAAPAPAPPVRVEAAPTPPVITAAQPASPPIDDKVQPATASPFWMLPPLLLIGVVAGLAILVIRTLSASETIVLNLNSAFGRFLNTIWRSGYLHKIVVGSLLFVGYCLFLAILSGINWLFPTSPLTRVTGPVVTGSLNVFNVTIDILEWVFADYNARGNSPQSYITWLPLTLAKVVFVVLAALIVFRLFSKLWDAFWEILRSTFILGEKVDRTLDQHLSKPIDALRRSNDQMEAQNRAAIGTKPTLGLDGRPKHETNVG